MPPPPRQPRPRRLAGRARTAAPPGLAGGHRWAWGRWKPPVMQTLWNAGRRLMNREIHDLLDYSRPVACTTVAATTGNLHTKGLVCAGSPTRPAIPSLSAWHYHAAQSQAGHIGALIATLLDQSPSPGEALAHALATTRTPIPLTAARRR